jgi:hypothetical protein
LREVNLASLTPWWRSKVARMILAEEGAAKVYGLSMGTGEKEMEIQKGKISSARNLPR